MVPNKVMTTNEMAKKITWIEAWDEVNPSNREGGQPPKGSGKYNFSLMNYQKFKVYVSDIVTFSYEIL